MAATPLTPGTRPPSPTPRGPAIALHPENPKVFLFRGRPLVLVCATEHYGAVLNRPFRFERYLADAAEKGQTLTRLFMLFREQQSALNPYSTCKPESPDYIAPFRRTGPGKALDGQPKYDLDQPNPEFFERLHAFLALAADYGIVVEVTLLSNTYCDPVWALNPFHPANNLNLDPGRAMHWADYMTARWPALFERQCAHVRAVVEQTHRYDNIIYEICNEPGGFQPEGTQNLPTPAEVNAWQERLIAVVRDAEAGRPLRHLISGQEAFTYNPFVQTSDTTFERLAFEVVNMHPLPGTVYRDKTYDMGEFMGKQLRLAAVRDFALATYAQPKPLNYDEDNAATQYKEPEGWTIHRKRAWTTLFCGGHYDMIDFSILPYLETGTAAAQRGIRSWMQHLAQFIHTVDLVHARPLAGWLREKPEPTVASVLAVPGADYCVYLADSREREEPGCGAEIVGALAFELPAGEYQVACFPPMTGVYSPAVRLQGGAIRLDAPPFRHDLVLRITRLSG